MLMREMIRQGEAVEGDGPIPYLVQTEAPSSDGGILRAAGARWDRFDKNPVVLFGHENGARGPTGGLPIGKVVARRLVDTARGPGTGWEQDIALTPISSDLDSDIARNMRTIQSFIRSGDLRAASIRFEVNEQEDLTAEMKLDLGLPFWGWVGLVWTAIETSIVSLGADPEALRRGVEAGVVTAEDLERIMRPLPYEIRSKAEPVDTGARELAAAIRENTDEIRGLRAEMIGLTETLQDEATSATKTKPEATKASSGIVDGDAHDDDLGREIDDAMNRLKAVRRQITNKEK